MPQPKHPKPTPPPAKDPDEPDRIVAPPPETGQRKISEETAHRLMWNMLSQNKVADAGPRLPLVVVVVGLLLLVLVMALIPYCR